MANVDQICLKKGNGRGLRKRQGCRLELEDDGLQDFRKGRNTAQAVVKGPLEQLETVHLDVLFRRDALLYDESGYFLSLVALKLDDFA